MDGRSVMDEGRAPYCGSTSKWSQFTPASILMGHGSMAAHSFIFRLALSAVFLVKNPF